MAEDIWAIEDRPILEAIAHDEQAGDEFQSTLRELDLPQEVKTRALKRLYQAQFITGITMKSGDGFRIAMPELLERGRRAVGQWPSESAADELIAVLASAEAAETDPERKARLKAAGRAVSNLGRDLLVEVTGAYLARVSGAS